MAASETYCGIPISRIATCLQRAQKTAPGLQIVSNKSGNGRLEWKLESLDCKMLCVEDSPEELKAYHATERRAPDFNTIGQAIQAHPGLRGACVLFLGRYNDAPWDFDAIRLLKPLHIVLVFCRHAAPSVHPGFGNGWLERISGKPVTPAVTHDNPDDDDSWYAPPPADNEYAVLYSLLNPNTTQADTGLNVDCDLHWLARSDLQKLYKRPGAASAASASSVASASSASSNANGVKTPQFAFILQDSRTGTGYECVFSNARYADLIRESVAIEFGLKGEGLDRLKIGELFSIYAENGNCAMAELRVKQHFPTMDAALRMAGTPGLVSLKQLYDADKVAAAGGVCVNGVKVLGALD